MKTNRILSLGVAGAIIGLSHATAYAQSELYPKHFDLEQVTLLESPMKTAMEKNFEVLLEYDHYRLLTPYVRQSGLAATTDTESPYYGWEAAHPSFTNWGSGNFNLDGHVGGHYLSALALAYAACHDEGTRTQLKERMEYMVMVMKDCQDQYDNDNTGLHGFIGGQPINGAWQSLYAGDITPYKKHGGWVPLYCQHKILAGLRDAYVYGGNDVAKELFRKLADWSVNLVTNVSDRDMQSLLDTEHGGMNESMLDAYQLFGDEKYLAAAKKYTHRVMLDGMQTLSTTFLNGKHANTQVPKYIGMERIYEADATATAYCTAAENFWCDVAHHRTVCIGGNSVGEHFLAASSANRYIDHLDGPESCNSNNMLKLSEMMADRTHDARYADFYEGTLWNHILSTQDPTTGGYVYFTTLRPQGYRIYSQVNQGMWCCVGTGMENHSKYGHFVYTHDGNATLYVNLFTPSSLDDDTFVITQETDFPFEEQTTLTIGKGGTYAIAIRHPAWAGEGYEVAINGTALETDVTLGEASYVTVDRTWLEGDKVTVKLPMSLRYEVCPDYTDYIAFKYGPILLAAQTTAISESEAEATGLAYEVLPNEYGSEGRMDHAPGSRATSKTLTTAPLLIGKREDVLDRITRIEGDTQLRFTIDTSREGVGSYEWSDLTLQPFYQIHHARYQCYWYQQTAENYANSSMAETEAANEALASRTVDFVVPGEQQSEAGHEYSYSSCSTTGYYNTERYRDARANGYIQYTLYNEEQMDEGMSIMFRFNLADRGRQATLTVDGEEVAHITIPSSAKGSDSNGFYNVEYPIPSSLLTDTNGKIKTELTVRLTATSSSICPGIYYIRLLYGYDQHEYEFRARDWTTGDTHRLTVSNISYDEASNTIRVKSSGNNNVCLMLKYDETEYTIASDCIYLVVRGKDLNIGSGCSYLWWLNGVNHGTQVSPYANKAITVEGCEQQIVAWDMQQSGLYANFSGERPSVCMGKTIFGLTSSDGETDIYDINFVSDVEKYIEDCIKDTPNGISYRLKEKFCSTSYDLKGHKLQHLPQQGIYIHDGKKKLANQ